MYLSGGGGHTCLLSCVLNTVITFLSPFQLAELLGFSKLDLIQELLGNRHAIVNSVLQDTSNLLKSGNFYCITYFLLYHVPFTVSLYAIYVRMSNPGLEN